VHDGALRERIAVLDLAEVAEEVVAALVGLDEPEALLAPTARNTLHLARWRRA